MVGEQDVTGDFFSESRVFLEFRFGNAIHDLRAAAFIGEHLPAIEPVFAMVAAHEDL